MTADPGRGADALTRAVALYRRTATSRSGLLLLVANAIPLVGVLFFGWSLWTILVLYWLENGIVGFWNVPKIALAQGGLIPTLPELPPDAALSATADPAQAAALRTAWAQLAQARQGSIAAQGAGPQVAGLPGCARVGFAGFFVVHYGMFWFVHGVFIMVLPLFLGGDGERNGAFGEIDWSSVGIAAAALFLSHGASFLFNYIGRGEYITATPGGQMAAPYVRVVILHLTIIFGAFVVAILGSPVGALLVLVILKTAFDLGLHLREHSNSGPRLPTGIGPTA